MNKTYQTNKITPLLFMILALSCFTACGQNNTEEKASNSKQNNTIKTIETMNTEKLTNPTVKQAIEALEAQNKEAWFSLFTAEVNFTDDGNKRDFKAFFDNAINHKEKFLSFDKVENDGKDIYGKFFAGQWGTFDTYFKFTVNAEGKISALAIGQM